MPESGVRDGFSAGPWASPNTHCQRGQAVGRGREGKRHLLPSLPIPVKILTASTACNDPITPVTPPSTPSSSHEPTVVGFGGVGNIQLRVFLSDLLRTQREGHLPVARPPYPLPLIHIVYTQLSVQPLCRPAHQRNTQRNGSIGEEVACGDVVCAVKN